MPRAKKPWRTVIMSEETGRFTRAQIREAVLAVKAEREARAAKKSAKRPEGTAQPREGSSGSSAAAA
jgi:hypothetical protein